jgi:hypothetical protein
VLEFDATEYTMAEERSFGFYYFISILPPSLLILAGVIKYGHDLTHHEGMAIKTS